MDSMGICFSHREEITAERLTPFRVFIIANPREKFTPGEVNEKYASDKIKIDYLFSMNQ